MVDSSRPGFAPYGAYELKSTYQRNLMFGMLSAVLLSVLTVSIPAVLSQLTDRTGRDVVIDSRDDDDPIIVIVRPEVPPSIVQDRPVVPVAPPSDVVFTGNVRAVEESLMGDDPGAMLPTQQDVSNLLGPGSQPGDESQPSNLGIVDTGDAFPPADSFIPLEIPPEMITYVTPEYPRLARELGLTGKLWVKALLDQSGHVRNAQVAVSSEFELLDRAAVEAAYKNVFKPGIQNGRAVSCWVSYAVEFKLQ